ncbi:hypothetical protein [Flavivirga sp. 57AJ16]|uniref:hypothetical protein n=1 Tax=Flavivirga sp. 57AJ16 TaxID=3025307 RepID=UPI002365DD40|nr:hypothetical protein [Flavivirga sp. 57AJ16]MDD7887892.1 hypothetical protein [Flavivirga sp. 57AJ16]
MQTNYLLPNKYKTWGWVLFISGITGGLFLQIGDFIPDVFGFITDFGFDFLDEIISILIIIGGLLVGFSKEKIEDEFIYKLRKDSLVWAIILNYTVLLLSIICLYDGNFFTVMIYNMFTPLIFFIIRFNFLKLKSRSHEE